MKKPKCPSCGKACLCIDVYGPYGGIFCDARTGLSGINCNWSRRLPILKLIEASLKIISSKATA